MDCREATPGTAAVLVDEFDAGQLQGAPNQLHWVLDVVMDEDQAQNRKDHGPENLALLRKFALNLAKLEPSKGSMRGKLKRAGWDNAFLGNLLAQFISPQMR